MTHINAVQCKRSVATRCFCRPGSVGKAPQAYRHHLPVWPMAPHSTCPESDNSCCESPDGIVMLGASLPVHTQKAPVLPVARDSIVPVLYSSVELMNLAEQLILHSKYQHHQGSDVVCGVLDSQQRLSGTGVSSSACMSVRQSHVVSLWGQKASCTRQGPGQKASGPCNGQGGRARLLLVLAGQYSRKQPMLKAKKGSEALLVRYPSSLVTVVRQASAPEKRT